MACDCRDRVTPTQDSNQGAQPSVLLGGERLVVAAFEFDANREVVAVFPTLPAGFSGVPGTQVAADELDDPAIAAQVKMGGYLQRRNFRKIGVDRRIESIAKKILDPVTAKFAGRQADAVDDEQRNFGVGRSLAEIW